MAVFAPDLNNQARSLLSQSEAVKKIPACITVLGTRINPTTLDKVVDLTTSQDPTVIEVRNIVKRNLFKGIVYGGAAGFLLSLPNLNIRSTIISTVLGGFWGGTVGLGVTYFLPQPAVREYLRNETAIVLRKKDFKATAERLVDLDDRLQDFVCPISGGFIKDPVRIPGANHYYERSELIEWIESWCRTRQNEVDKRDRGEQYNEGYAAQLEDPNYPNCPFRINRITVEEIKNYPFETNYLSNFKEVVQNPVFSEADATIREDIEEISEGIQEVRTDYIAALISRVWVATARNEISKVNAEHLTKYFSDMM